MKQFLKLFVVVIIALCNVFVINAQCRNNKGEKMIYKITTTMHGNKAVEGCVNVYKFYYNEKKELICADMQLFGTSDKIRFRDIFKREGNMIKGKHYVDGKLEKTYDYRAELNENGKMKYFALINTAFTYDSQVKTINVFDYDGDVCSGIRCWVENNKKENGWKWMLNSERRKIPCYYKDGNYYYESNSYKKSEDRYTYTDKLNDTNIALYHYGFDMVSFTHAFRVIASTEWSGIRSKNLLGKRHYIKLEYHYDDSGNIIEVDFILMSNNPKFPDEIICHTTIEYVYD